MFPHSKEGSHTPQHQVSIREPPTDIEKLNVEPIGRVTNDKYFTVPREMTFLTIFAPFNPPVFNRHHC